MTLIFAALLVVSVLGLAYWLLYALCEISSDADDTMDRELRRECERRQR